MQKRARHKEWAHLRVSGRPLLTGIALGTTPLLWVACRTSPCLVHVFQDGVLEAVLHFRSEPTFLLLGESVGKKQEVSSSGQDPGSRSGAASLLVITADGGIWLLEVPSSRLSSQKIDEDQQGNSISEPESAGRAKSLGQPKVSSDSWQLFEDNDAYEGGSQCTYVENQRQPCISEAHSTASLNLVCRNLEVAGSRSTFESVKAKSVASEALMAVVPTARVAAFATNSSVVVVAQTGPPIFLQAGSKQLQGPYQGCISEQVCEPTCLLFGWNLGMNCQKEDEARGYALSEKLFKLIAGQGDYSTIQYVLLQGDNRGRVYVYAVPNLGLNEVPSKVLCDLQEPIVGLLPLHSSFKDDQAQGHPEIEGLLIIGRSGTVVALSTLSQESSDSPFLPSNNRRRMQDISLSVTDVGFHYWRIKSPVTSVCVVGSQYLCYTAGPDVCCAEIFESSSVSDGLSQTQRSFNRFRQTLLHKTVSIADRVCGVAGNASARRPFSGRPLVALTTRGRLISLELLDQPASNAVADKWTTSRPSTSWGVSQSRTRDKVKDLLQVVAEIARQTDMVKNHCKAINMALYELASSLHLAYELSKEKIGWPLICQTWTALHGSVPPARQPPVVDFKGIYCMVHVYQPPPLEVFVEHLAFAPASRPIKADDALFVPNPPPLAHVFVNLQNHSEYALSPYWTLILKFESVSPTCKPVAVYTSIVVNSSQGLQIGSNFSHDLKVKLPGSYLSPVVVTVFLCHVHEYHELLVSSQPGVDSASLRETTGSGYKFPSAALDGRAVVEGGSTVEDRPIEGNKIPGAVCFPLAQYRIDILSLLEAPPGGSSWCSTSAPRRKHDVGHSVVGSIEQDAEDDHMLSGRFSLDVFKQQVGAEDEELNYWKTFHLEDLLHKGVVSKAGDQISLMAPNKAIVTITIQRSEDRRKVESLFFQTTSEALCCLVREALLSRLIMCEREDTVDKSPLDSEKDRKKLKMRGGKLVGVVEEVTEQPEPDPKLATITKTKNLVEVLTHRAEAVTAEWKRIFTDNTPGSADTVAPLLAQTYEIVKDLVRTYKMHRNDPASDPF